MATAAMVQMLQEVERYAITAFRETMATTGYLINALVVSLAVWRPRRKLKASRCGDRKDTRHGDHVAHGGKCKKPVNMHGSFKPRGMGTAKILGMAAARQTLGNP